MYTFPDQCGRSKPESMMPLLPSNRRALAQQPQEVTGDFVEDQIPKGDEELNARWDLRHAVEVH